MSEQAASIGVISSAGLARVRPLSRVCPLVNPQGILAPERTPTLAAHERPFVRVHSLMMQQVSALCKRLLTDLTPEWLFAGVNPLVIAQVVALLEQLFAIAAAEGLLSSVRSFVTCEGRRVKAGVRAETAPVSGQSSGSPWPSNGRHVRNDLRRGVALIVLVARCFLFDDRVRSGPISKLDTFPPLQCAFFRTWRRFCNSRSDDKGGTAVCPPSAVHLRLLPLEPRYLAGNASRALAVCARPLAFESCQVRHCCKGRSRFIRFLVIHSRTVQASQGLLFPRRKLEIRQARSCVNFSKYEVANSMLCKNNRHSTNPPTTKNSFKHVALTYKSQVVQPLLPTLQSQ
ncbi:unnamed protein product, partial [Ixodes pacificus]